MHLIRALLLLSSTAITLTNALTINTPKIIYNSTANFENLAIRPNGNILVTRFDVPQLWEINPSNGSGSLVHDFQSASTNVILGITEYEKDVYTVGGGTINRTTLLGKPGTWAVWKVDLRARHAPAKVDLITTIPEGIFLNGMAVLPPPDTKGDANCSVSNTVLASDSTAGLIYAVDPAQKSYKVFYSNPDTMLPATDAIAPFVVNGVRITKKHGRAGYLYYSTSFPSGFYRVRVDKDNVVQGAPELLSSPNTAIDDFALAKDGTAYLTSNVDNYLLKRETNGNVTVIGGNGTTETVFAGSTSVRLGKVRGRDIAYVTTSRGRILAFTP